MAIRCRRLFRQDQLRQVSQHKCFLTFVTAGVSPAVTLLEGHLWQHVNYLLRMADVLRCAQDGRDRHS